MASGSTQLLVKMSTRNISGGKGGRCVRLTTSTPSCAECHVIREPKPPGTLWATPGLLRDSFTFYLNKIKQNITPTDTTVLLLLLLLLLLYYWLLVSASKGHHRANIYKKKLKKGGAYETKTSILWDTIYRGGGKSLARPGRKQATATEDFDFHISYL